MRSGRFCCRVAAAMFGVCGTSAVAAPPLRCVATSNAAASSEAAVGGLTGLHGRIAVEQQTANRGRPLVLLGFLQNDGRQVQIVFENMFPKAPTGWFHGFRATIEYLQRDGTPIRKSKAALVDMRSTTFDIRFGPGPLELEVSSRDPRGKPTRETITLEVPALDTSKVTLGCYGGTFSISDLNLSLPAPAVERAAEH